MNNPYMVTDTVTLLGAIDNQKPPAAYLVDTFFSNALPTSNTSFVAVEYRKGKRLLAPYIVNGGKGVSVARQKADAKLYAAPMMGVRRNTSMRDLELRQFGETPIFTTVTPQERAARLQAEDLQDLSAMLANRRNHLAASILQTGGATIQGYADDGEVVIEDTIQFDWNGVKNCSWDTSNATIYQDLLDAVELIAENTGTLPTMMLCGRNVEKYLLNNKEIKDWLGVSNRQTWLMATVQPKYLSPQTRYIGTISALGLEIYSYYETYTADDGTLQSFLDADTVIVGSPALGRQLYGAVSLIDKNSGVQTYAAHEVPHYVVDDINQKMSLTLYSRCLLVPDDSTSWVCLKVKQ